jgi:hypothetical protein
MLITGSRCSVKMVKFGSSEPLMRISIRQRFADPSGSGSPSPTLNYEIWPCAVTEVPVNPPAFATGLRFPPAAEWRDLAQL